MQKKTYYVSVQAGDVLEDKEAAAFEFEIEATDEQVSRLQEAMDEWQQADSHSVATLFNYMSDESPDNEKMDDYDVGLHYIYGLIHEMGTEETRKHIESMGVLDND
ncbi:hypothetical protein [Paenibacillus koleovorans]|uniref:hypothetical protein n=1 Tax=Paenibacillus koleovorans TaxID=121608 RepID=UPI001FE54FF1|nr:hypothetical protein [Paenibacillus koleovorans]